MIRFVDTLRRLPPTHGKPPPKGRHRSLAEIIAEVDAKGAPGVEDKTVKRHLSALSSFFRYVWTGPHHTAAARGADRGSCLQVISGRRGAAGRLDLGGAREQPGITVSSAS